MTGADSARTMVTAAMVALPREVNRTTLIIVVGILFEIALIVWLARATTAGLNRLRARRGETRAV